MLASEARPPRKHNDSPNQKLRDMVINGSLIIMLKRRHLAWGEDIVQTVTPYVLNQNCRVTCFVVYIVIAFKKKPCTVRRANIAVAVIVVKAKMTLLSKMTMIMIKGKEKGEIKARKSLI